ncbi:MAG TPA: hypothetical protein VMT70_23875 [Vicinamibacteria bacterium]|nr:hypothetical protein [Vicinamibacteria bacterium]
MPAVTLALAGTALALAVAAAGRLIWSALRTNGERLGGDTPPRGWADAVEESFCGLVSGFAVLSACFFLLAHVGLLTTRAVLACIAAVVCSGAAVCYRRGVLRAAWAGLHRDLAAGLTVLALSLIYGALLPPFDTTLAGSDSSVYLAAAHQLARQGTIRHHDALVAEMTVAEREAFFANRDPGDHTGPYARLPGGVPLVSPLRDEVTFYFYHLLPVWLAVGLLVLGGGSYLCFVSVFGCLGLLSVFLVGRRLGGGGLGAGAAVVHASFYPQAFFSRLPMSELLAQALFVSGLVALLRGLDEDEGAVPHLRLAGLAWGALCLCRVDAWPLLWLGLAGMSLLPARAGLRERDWAIPMLVTAPFGAMAVYHQLSNGLHYVGPVGHGRLAAAVGAAVTGHPWLDGVVLAVLAAAAVFALRCEEVGPSAGRLGRVLQAGGLAASVLSFGFALRSLEWGLAGCSFRWIALYTTPLLLSLLGGGVWLAVSESRGAAASRSARGSLALFAGPAVCYLVNPMVIAVQPWAVRRFVPTIFPLLFVLALYGWRAALRRLCGPRAVLARALFAALVAATSGTFLRFSGGLAMPATRADASRPVEALAQAIPRGAVVVVPDSDAGFHAQTALEFTGGRDVLLLPFQGEPARRLEDAAARYLAREIGRGRRVFLLVARPGDPGDPIVRRFRTAVALEASLPFEKLPFAVGDRFPGSPKTDERRLCVLELHAGPETRESDVRSAGTAPR